ncbi:MAG: hypothetical protein WCS27_07790 [Victivallaceae bacterium]
MSKIGKRNYLSLVEALFAIALLAIFFNLATMFYYDGRKTAMKSMDKASHARSVSTLAENWRNFIHTASEPVKVEADKILFKNHAAIEVKNGQLVFSKPDGQKSFALAKNFTASFELEKNPGESPLLVLYLKSKGSKGQVLKDKFIRIAAAAGGGGK